VIVERSFNEGEIKSVITHPDIYPRLCNENSPKPEEWRPARNRIYLTGKVDSKAIGVTSYNRKTDIQYVVHFQVIPEYRKSHAIKFAQKSIKWLWDNTDAQKIVAEVPEFHENVVKFSLKVGFEIEGKNKQSVMKDGRLFDQYYLGLTK